MHDKYQSTATEQFLRHKIISAPSHATVIWTVNNPRRYTQKSAGFFGLLQGEKCQGSRWWGKSWKVISTGHSPCIGGTQRQRIGVLAAIPQADTIGKCGTA